LTTAVLPDGRVVALVGGTSHNRVAQVRDIATGELIAELAGHSRWVESLATAVLPSGQVVGLTGGGFGDRTVRMWDLADGRPIAEFHGDDNGGYRTLTPVQLPDGRPVVLAGRAGPYPLQGWDLLTHARIELPVIFHQPGIAATAAVARPGGLWVITAGYGDGTVAAWDLATGTRIAELRIAEAGVMDSVATAVLADGRTVGITAGARENLVRVWDVATGHPVGPPLVVPFDVRALAVHQAEVPVLVVGGNGTAAVELRHAR
jgi:WD40 repeat protein